MKMLNHYDAFWLKDFTIYLVNRTHIASIIDNPKLFEISKEKITSIYSMYNEKLYFEGGARTDIIKLISLNGWIRIRHYRKPMDYWSVQADKYLERKENIEWFINYAIENQIMKGNDSFQLTGYYDGYFYKCDYTEGGIEKFIEQLR